ncbi:hypothetical protein [Avrilella dinanensis]|uniref:DUF3887 domain-containing protein n=1 Tax=Avrilella dinanensis TaxID=2008672 RepID=A0A2M9R2S9_9FLAO|nr:hypothetical protein [Avrilella dinanensis]PJR03170.1 hypothetical protein CDL10_00660 [Avrilella dinanensis]
MKKNILAIIGLTLLFTSCNIKGKMEKHNKAQKESDYIMENLTSSEILNRFPEKYFPKDQTEQLFEDIKTNCDWENKEGKFVDFFTMNNNGKNSTAYIYEYFLKCDSLRFVLIYDMDQEEPELFRLNIEPIEQPSQMIIDPSKQLINQQ